MRVKSNTALRASARFARRSVNPQLVMLPEPDAVLRRPWLRVGAAHTVAAAVAGILYASVAAPAHAAAQDQAPATSAASANSELQEVVVTASAQAVKKLDASYNIVSASQNEIAMANPASTAEIYKLSPGV